MSNIRLDPCLPVPIQSNILQDVIEKAKDWALMHGACMRSKTSYNTDVLQFAPFVLLPSVFPRKEFDKAVTIQPILNELMHTVAHDETFLVSCLKNTIEVDDFTRKLFEIYKNVKEEGFSQQNLCLGLFRSDYLLHNSNNYPIKQVELNTIASSFAGISSCLADFHRYVLQELGYTDKLNNLPLNSALSGLCGGLSEAWRLYGNRSAVILFIIEDVTYNICDQRFHEFYIRENFPHIRVIRRTLTDIGLRGKLDDMKSLFIDEMEVAVIYFRAGYTPDHYHGDTEWKGRLLMERSRAIKCPSIQYHLAGTKKVQQSLARPSVLEKFLKDADKVKAVKEIFTGLYSLDNDEFGDKAIEMAIDDPDKYVLKPQREGGGNNIYGTEIRDVIMSMKNSNERSAWILMDRIEPPVQFNYIVRPGGSDVPELTNVVSELGIFGVIIGDSNSILMNKQVGHMLRTKSSSANEGGVASGLGALDSPFLIDFST